MREGRDGMLWEGGEGCDVRGGREGMGCKGREGKDGMLEEGGEGGDVRGGREKEK